MNEQGSVFKNKKGATEKYRSHLSQEWLGEDIPKEAIASLEPLAPMSG